LGDLAKEYADLSIGSYPYQKDGKYGANIVFRGTDEGVVDAAIVKLTAVFPT
jgi:hypothetical protein